MAKQPAGPSSGGGDPQHPQQHPQQDPRQDERLWTLWRDFGHELQSLRTRRGLALRQLADKAHVSPQTVIDLERGFRQLANGQRVIPNPRDDVLGRIAQALAVPVERLFAKVGQQASRPQTRKGWRGYARPEGGAERDDLEQRLARMERVTARVAEKLGVNLEDLDDLAGGLADAGEAESEPEPPKRRRGRAS